MAAWSWESVPCNRAARSNGTSRSGITPRPSRTVPSAVRVCSKGYIKTAPLDSCTTSPTKTTPAVRAAYERYDLTFLVHASIEHNRALLDHWLHQVGVSTQSLMNARIGRR